MKFQSTAALGENLEREMKSGKSKRQGGSDFHS
jgi:hypothetical protein